MHKGEGLKCHICGSGTESFIDEASGILYYQCDNCDTIFKSPEIYQSIAQQKSRYDLHNNDENDEGYRAYYQRFLDFVLPHTSDVKKALDFGCGRSTLLANMLKSLNIDTDVYDPIYHPDTAYEEKKYELIVSTEVFEHLHDPKAVFTSLSACLNSNGYLAIQTQFHPKDVALFKKWYYHKDPTHIVFFTPKTFKCLASPLGLRFVAQNGKNMILFKKG